MLMRNQEPEIRMTNQIALLKSLATGVRAPTLALPRSTRGGEKRGSHLGISGEQNQIGNQNDRMGWHWSLGHWDLIRYSGFGFLVFLAVLAGCTGNAQSRQELHSGKLALDSQQYNQAILDADAVIAGGDAPALAEAYYLRGYAIEMRPKVDNEAAAHDLEMARDSYSKGLSHDPRPTLAARLHAQLGNVCYNQQDYSAAVPELNAAFNATDTAEPKDWILYRMGVGQQRLGRFEDADVSFQRLVQDYPNSQYAGPARGHKGIRGFFVQLGAYSRQSDIDAAARAVSAAGSAPLKTYTKGLTVIRTADVPSFGQAEGLRDRLVGAYPDARVMP
jgi:tetratricopeptide (TPR) repeat protein